MKKIIPAIFILAGAVLLLAACGNPNGTDSPEQNNGKNLPKSFRDGDLSIHFLELGNKFIGDCVYVNYDDVDIIIDAGSRQDSAATICAYIDQYIKDDKLEFVIATHAHQDHIAGFYTARGITGVLDAYEIGTIIDFPKTNSTTATYDNYIRTRDNAVARGALHYNALQCYNNEDGGQRVYNLGGGVELEILYNYYYEHNSDEENNYSVCVRIIQDGRQYIFTGDLEKPAEDMLVDYYDAYFGGLGHCTLYKGGHHGSSTSSNENLMAAITPDYICICTCAGSPQYSPANLNQFPTQDFINRIAPCTDEVYLTTLITDYANNKYTSFNGDIIFLVSDGGISIICSNNDRKLKDTDWFRDNRIMPAAWAGGSSLYAISE